MGDRFPAPGGARGEPRGEGGGALWDVQGERRGLHVHGAGGRPGGCLQLEHEDGVPVRRAEWETPLNKRNQVLLWDRIIESREEGVLSLPHLRNHMDSPLADQGKHLLGRDINVTVSWNVIPHIGKLYTGHKSFPFTMPNEYVRQYE